MDGLKSDASLFPFGGESIIQWSMESSWREKSTRSEQAIPVYLVFMLLDWWRSHASVLGSTHHHTKLSWLCHGDILSCPVSYCIFGPTGGLALVHQSSLSILLAEVNRYPDTRR